MFSWGSCAQAPCVLESPTCRSPIPWGSTSKLSGSVQVAPDILFRASLFYIEIWLHWLQIVHSPFTSRLTEYGLSLHSPFPLSSSEASNVLYLSLFQFFWLHFEGFIQFPHTFISVHMVRYLAYSNKCGKLHKI